MATIGLFNLQADGRYLGAIKTLALKAQHVEFRPCDPTDGGPSFRIHSGETEIGAAWKKLSREGREYLSVKLDDPSFPVPVYASLVRGELGYSLIWSRARSAD